MRPTRLRHFARQRPNPLPLVSICNADLSDLLPPLARGKRHAEEVAEGVAEFVAGGPDRADFVRAQGAFPLPLRTWHLDQGDGTCLDNPALQRPVEEFADGGKGAVGGDGFPFVNYFIEKINYISSCDRPKSTTPPTRENVLVEVALCLLDVSRRFPFTRHVAAHKLFDHLLNRLSVPLGGRLLLLDWIAPPAHGFV